MALHCLKSLVLYFTEFDGHFPCLNLAKIRDTAPLIGCNQVVTGGVGGAVFVMLARVFLVIPPLFCVLNSGLFLSRHMEIFWTDVFLQKIVTLGIDCFNQHTIQVGTLVLNGVER